MAQRDLAGKSANALSMLLLDNTQSAIETDIDPLFLAAKDDLVTTGVAGKAYDPIELAKAGEAEMVSICWFVLQSE